jgi:hypothetical protein
MIRAAIGAVVAVLCVLGVPDTARGDVGTVSPGKLAAAHASLESQCNRCHVPFGGIPQRQCLTCHTALADRIARGIGLHATVKAQPCTDCHKEHHGRDTPLAPAPPQAFDHRTTAFRLDGDHGQLACDRCHPRTGASQRWVGIASTCQSCHADRAHRGTLGSNCAMCHRANGWIPALHTAEEHRTPLTGGHAKLACVDCHRSGLHVAPQQTCAACHAQRHGGTTAACTTCHRVSGWTQVTYTHRFPPARLPGKHQTAACLACHPAFRFRNTSFACAACHDQERPHEPLGACDGCHSAQRWQTSAFDHDQPSIRFALTGRHRTARCASCHTQGATFLGAPRACAGCHVDPHRGQFGGPAAGVASHPDRVPPGAPSLLSSSPITRALATPRPRAGDCNTCHTTAGWRPSTIDAAAHAGFGYPLRGAHASTGCARCHATGVFVGTARTCAGCHPDVRHRGRFGADCASCHDETAWSRTARFDHARTGFVLDKGHASVGCPACHGSDGLRLARAAAPTACQTCHASPHGTQFGTRCTGCHTTASFRSTPPFDHAARTDFPLELRHATLRCSSCHDSRRPVANPACRTCHGDPHRGSNSLDCADCHRADRWRIIRFDHDLTSYPLVGRHRIASCGGCHTNPNWTGVRSDCVACHAFDRPRTQDHLTTLICDDCHTSTSWRTIRATPRR